MSRLPSLPREMRSDTCNDFYCEYLSAWRAHADGKMRSPGALVIVRGQDLWSRRRNVVDQDNGIVRVALVTEQGIVPAPAVTAPPEPAEE